VRAASPHATGLGLALGLALAATAAADDGAVYVVDPARSRIRFHAVSRLMDADGRFHRFGGEVRFDPARPEATTARLTIDVGSIDTGIRLRDDHLRSDDFFDAARYPEARFVASAVRRQDGRYLVSGTLTIRGTTRPVTAPVTVAASADALEIAGELTVSRRQFGIAYQSFLNPIRDEVRVWVELVATRR
jgi:polyisoprenoid-binding protein YceI